MIELQVLGGTTLCRDGRVLNAFVAGPKRLGLLIYLVLARPRGFHRRDELLPLFWPERGQKSARNALSNMLYHIRQELGEDVIVNRGAEEVGVQRDRLSCDVLAFEEALDRGNVEQALGLYRGDFLQGFHVPDVAPAFDQWLDRERERLRLRAAEGAWACAAAAERAGDRQTARLRAKQAAGFTPFSDEAQTRLIRLLKRIGDRAGARKAYEVFAERLRSEWDMEPTDELTALVKNMSEGGTEEPASPQETRTAFTSAQQETSLSASEGSKDSPPLDESRASVSTDAAASSPMRASIWPERRSLLGGMALLLILSVALGWMFWSGGPAHDATPLAAAEPSVAILPFTYLGAGDSTDYFSLGITEEILTRLAQVSDLSVISRTSVMQYRDTEKPLRTIGQELGASVIVEGSVQRAGDQVRITAQLIDARTDRHLWGTSYDRSIADILAVQSDVATQIAEALQANLLSQERAQLSAQRNVNGTAYHLYLRAQHLQDTREPEGIVRAKTLYEKAIRRDSSFAPAYGGLATAYVRLALIDWMDRTAVQVTGIPAKTAIPRALRAADQALALDSTVVEAHVARGLAYHIFTREWKTSEQAFQHALALNPNHSEALVEYGHFQLRLGRIDAALSLMKRAVELDPFSGAAHSGLGYTHLCMRRYRDAIQELETALALDSGSPFTPKYLGHVHVTWARELAQAGRNEDAATHLKRAVDMVEMVWGPDPTHQTILEHAIAGREKKTLELLRKEDYTGPKLWPLMLLNESEAAVERVIRHGFIWGVYSDPLFDPFRDDPRFEQVVERNLKYDVDVR